MQTTETRGIVLFSKPYKEKDRLITVFTEDYGKRVFFVKNFEKSRIAGLLPNFTTAKFFATINDSGFSFINDLSDIEYFQALTKDIEIEAYAAYIMSLADLVLSDRINEADPKLFQFLLTCLKKMNQGFDYQIVTNIFELQLLSKFGVPLDLSACMICGCENVPMVYSFAFNGPLCENDAHRDEHHLRTPANIIYFASQLLKLNLQELESIEVKSTTKKGLRLFIDQLYDEYVGFQTNAKRFLDSMDNWPDLSQLIRK